jgi:uncharacterized protein YabN with tetrapyrrole methylase and pyrophosphatase domain
MMLFAIANLARKLGVEPETALRRANDKFTARFAAVEARLRASGSSIQDADLERIEEAWKAVKTAEKAGVTTGDRRPDPDGRQAEPAP